MDTMDSTMDHEPLLRGENDDQHEVQATEEPIELDGFIAFDNAQYNTFFICVLALKFCCQFTFALLEVPMIRLIEQLVCRSYIESAAVDSSSETECKISEVQDRLAFILGFKLGFDSLPCLLVALIYSQLADSRGRRVVLVLAATGQLLALSWIMLVGFGPLAIPAQIIWLSSIFLFIGGGKEFEASMIVTTFSDAIPWNKRTRSLFYLHAVSHSARLLGPFVSSRLMKIYLWAPFCLALFIFSFKYLLIWVLPESSPFSKQCSRDRLASENNNGPISLTERTNSTSILKSLAIKPRTLWHWIRQSKIRNFLAHRGLLIILASFIIKRISFSSEQYTFQYASEILHKPLYQTTWLRSLNALGATVVLSILLPLATQISGLKSPVKDIWVLRGSLLDLIAGFTVLFKGKSFLALCIGMTICGLGEGLEPGLQALGAYIVGKANHASFFASSSMLTVLGDLLSGPIMAWAYTFRGSDDMPIGFCFLLSVILFGFLFLATFVMNSTQI